MQRLKDFLNGDAQTPPSLNPNHTVKDDLKHAAKDLVHAKDDIKGQIKHKAHEVGQDVRGTARAVEDRAADLRDDVRDRAAYVRDDVRDRAAYVRSEVREDLRDARDTGRQVTNEAAAKARAAGREVAADVDDLTYRARVKAHNAKVELSNDAHDAARAVGNGLRDVTDTVIGGIVLVEDKIENGFDRLAAKAHHAAERARQEAHNIAVDVRNGERRLENKVQQVANEVDQRLSHIKFANYQAPWFRDVGYDYDVTFYQPRLVGKRVAITTPNLLGNRVRGAEWTVSTVHGSAESAASEQLASNFRWQGEFFGRRPIVAVQATNGANRTTEWEFRRPQRVVFDTYASLPTSGGRPTLRTGVTITDRISRSVLGGSFKLSGNQWLAAYQTRLPYVSLAGALASDASGEQVALSGGVASTVYSDDLRESQVNVGVEVKSGKYSTKQSSVPDSVASVTAKIEYDEPAWNVDARIRARNYTDSQTSQQTLKISDAHLRGLYVWNQGQYPRTAVGVTVGVGAGGSASDVAATEEDVASAAGFLPYGDPDRRVASQWFGAARGKAAASFASGLTDAPLIGVSVHHAINPQNRVAFGLTSLRGLAASFNYRLRPDISIQTSVSTDLPSWNVLDVAKTGGIGKPQLGLALTIGAI